MRHTVIVIDRTKTDGSTIVEQAGCGRYVGAAIATYRSLVEEYEEEIAACTHHVELICNNDAPPPLPFLEECDRPPTSGFNKLGPAAQDAARSRAKNFYPFD